MLVVIVAAADGVDDAERRDEHFACGERADQPDADLPVEAQRFEDRLDRMAEAAAVAGLEVRGAFLRGELGLRIRIGGLRDQRRIIGRALRQLAREVEEGPQRDRAREDHGAGFAQEHRRFAPHHAEHVARAREAIRRQLDDEGQPLRLERLHGLRDHPRSDERRDDAERVHRDHQERLREPRARDERRDDERVDRQARRAGHQRHDEHRQQAVALALHRARRGDGRDRACEAEQHRHECTPVQVHRAHHAIHQVRDAREIAAILEEAEEQEQHQDLRHEHEHRAHAGDHAIDEEIGEDAVAE